MDTHFSKGRIFVIFLSVITVMTALPVKAVMAADQTNRIITEVETKAPEKEEESNAERDTKVQMNAGAAAILDADITIEDAEIVEIVKSNTTEAIEVKTLEKHESDLVMANVNKYVNVRAEASAESEKLGQLYKDCGGHIVDRQDGWTKITSGSITGWVKDDYLFYGVEAEDLAREVGMLTATSTTETLRVRAEASTESKILGLLSMGQTMEAIAEEGDWVSVSYEGTTAYVSAEYVKIDFEIDVAESMEEIREREAKEAEAKRIVQKEAIMTSAPELNILAALIQCEAGGEPYEGQVAVGAVVMNRVRCGGYPNSIAEVIYASGQFSPANSGKMTNLVLSGNIKPSCLQAAQEAVNGYSNVGDAMHFRRAGSRNGIIIGNHVFW